MGVIIFIVIIGLIDWYAFQSFKTVSLDWIQAIPKSTLIISYWTINIGIPLIMLLSVAIYFSSNGFPWFGKWAVSFFITFLIFKAVLVLFLFGEDIYRTGNGILRYFNPESTDLRETFLPGRRKFISQIAIAAAALPFFSFVYGITKGKYNFKLHKIQIFFKDLPDEFDGFTISQISDVHSGSYDNPEGVMKGIDLINEQKSDLFVFTGDLVNTLASEFEPWKKMFSSIRAPFGQYSILGNHDYGDYKEWTSKEEKINNFNALVEHHRDTGFQLLRNEAIKLEKDGAHIIIAGVENWGRKFHQYGDLDKTLEGLHADDFVVLMSHDPTHFDEMVKKYDKKVHLTLSGHTHGMQMGVEFPWLKWSPIKYIYSKWAGLYEDNGRYLYVNRGFGFLGFAGRVGIWPEVTVFELKKQLA